MGKNDRVYWELLNNEIRKVSVEEGGSETVLQTRFRTLQNALKFDGVIWSDNLELMTGTILNYVEEIDSDDIADDVKEHLKDALPSADYEESIVGGLRSVFKIVCNRNKTEFLVVADNMRICINE